MDKVYLAYYHGYAEGPAVRLQFKPFATWCEYENDRPTMILGLLDWQWKCKMANDADNKEELRHWGGHLNGRWKGLRS